MARIVITSWGSYGDLNPYLGLALALKARGHTPLLATASHYKELIEGEGIDFAPVRPDIDVTDVELVRRAMDARKGPEVVIRETVAPAVEDSYADLTQAVHGADLLISHVITFAAPIIAQVTGMPWLSTVLAPTSFFSIHDFPVLPPASWLKSLEALGTWPNRLLFALARQMTYGWTEPVRKLRARLGLPRGGDPIYEGQHSPRGVLGLFPSVLAQPQPDWPPNTRVTGAIVHDVAHGRGLGEEIEAFLANGPAPVVFTLGSAAVLMGDAFYEESAKAVATLGCRALLLVGDERARQLQPTLPEGMLAVGAAPHSLLFPRAKAVVHHCGIGTLSQSLRAGRPLLGVPYSHDQPDNAWRAAQLGVARVVASTDYRAARVVRELRALMDDPQFERAAAAVAQRVLPEDGPRNACDAIERVLAAG
ncbi:MAG: glycosyltransferase [Gemmatimonadaceae bacterium]